MKISMKVEHIKGLIIDLDGVIFEGDKPLGDLQTWFEIIHDKKVGVVIATNNSSKTSEYVVDLLESNGAQLIPKQIITSGMVTLHYLSAKYPEGSKVYVIGTKVLKETLKSGGYTILDDANCVADVVVVGIDKTVTYDKLKYASLHVRAGAEFIATNDDRTVKSHEGLVPAAGTIVAAVEAATSRKAVIMGKPYIPMFNVALQQLGLEANKVLVVGDQLETDIRGAQAACCNTALVLTGGTAEKEAKAWQPQIDIVARDLGAVLNTLKGMNE